MKELVEHMAHALINNPEAAVVTETVNEDGWDLYFMFIGLYPHNNDMQFYCDTVWVLDHLDIWLKNMYVIHLNGDYVRNGELDENELFIVSDCFYNGKNHKSTPVEKAVRSK